MKEFIVSVTITLVLVVGISGSGQLEFIDGPTEKVIGFPFVWAMNGVNSLEIDIYILGLLLNLVFYFIVVFYFVRKLLPTYLQNQRIFYSIVLISSAVSVCVWYFVLGLSTVHVYWWNGFILGEDIKEFSIGILPIIG